MQTIAQFIEKTGLTLSANLVQSPVAKNSEDWHDTAYEYRVTIGYVAGTDKARQKHVSSYWKGAGHVVNSKATFPKPVFPTLVEVLDCLAKDSQGVGFDGQSVTTFEAWSWEIGYDTDSRKAEVVYKACIEIAEKLYKFLGRDAYLELVNDTENE